MDIGILIALIGILVTLAFGSWKLVKMFDWQKGMVSHELAKGWTDKTLKHKEVIEKKFGSYLSKVEQATVPNCEKFVNAVSGDELYNLKIAVISLMNYFEIIAVVYLNGMADTKVIDTTFKNAVLRYYHKIEKLADCLNRVAGYNSWEPVNQMIEIWNKQEQDEKKVKNKKWPF